MSGQKFYLDLIESHWQVARWQYVKNHSLDDAEDGETILLREKLGKLSQLKRARADIRHVRRQILLNESRQYPYDNLMLTHLNRSERDNLLLHIGKVLIEIANELKILEIYQTPDQESDETALVFTGKRGPKWYDKPLKHFITNFYTPNRFETVKQFIDQVKKDCSEIDHIGTPYGSIPVNEMIGMINQILVIYVNTNQERTDRAVFRLHHDYQIDPVELSEIINILGLMSCFRSCILDRSQNEFDKHASPAWAVDLATHVEQGVKIVDEGQGKDTLTEEEKAIFAKAAQTEPNFEIRHGGQTPGKSFAKWLWKNVNGDEKVNELCKWAQRHSRTRSINTTPRHNYAQFMKEMEAPNYLIETYETEYTKWYKIHGFRERLVAQ